MEASSYEQQQQQQQQPLMSGSGGGGGGTGGGAPPRPSPPPSSPFDDFAAHALAPAHFGTLPLALAQHPSAQLAALAVGTMLALQTVAPVAGAWAMLCAALLSALVQALSHTGGGGGAGARGRESGRAHNKGGPSALASVSLDAAVAIAAASWLVAWAWADPPGREFWLEWQPTLLLALIAVQLALAALVGMPCAKPLLHDKAPPLLMSMDLDRRPISGSPAEAPWLRALARDVTLAWAGLAALAAVCCAVPAALGRHAFARGGGPGGEGLGSAAGARGGGWAKGGGDAGGGGGGGAGGHGARVDADPLDVALSVCAPLALLLAAAALGDALCERARRAHLPRMMAEASRAAAAAQASGEFFAGTAPPSGGALGV
jgi:hypothetical protein